jgi:hypothetical protein
MQDVRDEEDVTHLFFVRKTPELSRGFLNPC